MSIVYLIQNPNNGEFFSSFYYSGEVSTIPVLFGAEEYKSKEDAFSFKNSDDRLKDFVVVARKSDISILRVEDSGEESKPHEQRVIDEQLCLQDKLNSLIAFLKKGKPDNMDQKAWILLDKQRVAMFNYNEILKQRIKMF